MKYWQKIREHIQEKSLRELDQAEFINMKVRKGDSGPKMLAHSSGGSSNYFLYWLTKPWEQS